MSGSKYDVIVSMSVYNRKEMTIKSIESFLENSPDNSKLMCVDNGSTDGIREVLSKWKNTKLDIHLSKTNLYPGNTVRYNLAKAPKAQMYYIADNDCYFGNMEWYDTAKRLFEYDPKISMIHNRKTCMRTHSPTKSQLKNKKVVEGIEFIQWAHMGSFTMINPEAKDIIVKHSRGRWIGGVFQPLVARRSSAKKTVKIIPGNVLDLSDEDLNNPENSEYYEKIWGDKGRLPVLHRRQKKLRKMQALNEKD